MRNIAGGVSLIAITLFATAAMAANLPRQGTFKGTFYGCGTYRATALGTERLLVAFDENGFSLTDGLFDHMRSHCWGTADFTNGMGQGQGYCAASMTTGNLPASTVAKVTRITLASFHSAMELSMELSSTTSESRGVTNFGDAA